MILKIMILAPVVIVSNDAFAQKTLHNQTLYETVKQTSGLGENSQIDVGNVPGSVGVNVLTDTVYVANTGSDTVSVISGENNAKIKDIPVGVSPFGIGVNPVTNTVYVANTDSNTTSVISGENNTKMGEDIPVGVWPIGIGVSPFGIGVNNPVTNTVYVSNSISNTISVISGENNTKIKDIPVGDGPFGIGVNPVTNTVYVANLGSGRVSVIDATANKVVAGVTFQVNPFNSGYIVCDGLTTPSPIGQYVYVYSGAECIAKPNEGFEFVSWEENLKGNSTQLITTSRPASTWDSISDFLGFESSDKLEAKLNVTKFGTFTANFKELPPAFPPEYLIPLYGIIASTIIGWSIPSIIGWAKSKRDVGKLNYYHEQITSLYGDGKLDEDDIEPLNRLRTNIVDAYSKGKINEKHYESLRNEISVLYEKIFRKKIDDSLNDNSTIKKPIQEQLAQIKNEVKYAYSEGKINEKHYDLLNKDILELESKEES